MTELYLNGEYLLLEGPRIQVEDRGFQFGDGVYEVIRVYGGRPFHLREHLARLDRSLAGLEIPKPPDRLDEVCRRLVRDLKESTIYIQITRGAGPRSHGFSHDLKPTVLAYARPYAALPAGKTFKLASMPDERWARCYLKTVNLLPNILAKQKALKAGCDEGLFVREDGTVTEGTSSNAFLVRGGALVTHPATERILNGITREAVLALAKEMRLPAREEAFPLRAALEADEFFMSGTTTEVMPVTVIDGRTIGSGTPGPVTLRLQAAYRALTQEENS